MIDYEIIINENIVKEQYYEIKKTLKIFPYLQSAHSLWLFEFTSLNLVNNFTFVVSQVLPF